MPPRKNKSKMTETRERTASVIKENEPPMFLVRPSAERSQDIRHVLAKCFRDLYKKETVCPQTVKHLQTSKDVGDEYHVKYVDSLQRVYGEWQRRMDEAAMLERHIMQSQAHAMSAEEKEINRTKENCDNYRELGLPSSRSHFRSCIDPALLKKHNLLTPEDYSPKEPIAVPPPQGPKVPSYARETMTSQQRTFPNESRLDSPFVNQALVSDEFPSYISDEDLETKGPSFYYELEKFPKSDAWKEHMSEEQREIERRDFANLQTKTEFLKNARFLPASAPAAGRSLIKSTKKIPKLLGIEPKKDEQQIDPAPIFIPCPSEVVFQEFKVGQVYEIVLELKNVSTVIRQCRALPASTPYVSVGLGQFPGDHGLVAPGMSCKYPIRFIPDSLMDFEDEVVIQTQSSVPLIVPIRGRRAQPILTLPDVLDTGHCLVGGYHVTQFFIKNEGGPGRFCIMPRFSWPATNFKSAVPEGKVVIPPFDIRPSTFELLRGQSGIVEVIFNPHAAKVYSQDITVACDNCTVNHMVLRGEGQVAEIELESVEGGEKEASLGELTDFSAKHRIVFDNLNPYTYTERAVVIKNLTKVDLPFEWLTYKPHMLPPTLPPMGPPSVPPTLASLASRASPSGHSQQSPDDDVIDTVDDLPQLRDRIPDLDTAFSVQPTNGTLAADEKIEFKVTFAPPVLNSYHSVLHMVLQQVPRTSQSMRAIVGRSSARTVTTRSRERPRPDSKSTRSTAFETSSESSGDDDGEVIIPIDGPIYCHMVGLELEVKGESVPMCVVLHPYSIVMSGLHPIGTTIKKVFNMSNHSFSTITFQWQPHSEKDIIEIEPPFGELDPGMMMDFELSVTGIEPGLISTTMYCYVLNMDEPLSLNLEVEMKGPDVTIEEPDVNFGLIRLGDMAEREITLYNQSQLITRWSLQDSFCIKHPELPCDMEFVPKNGELRPLERQVVLVMFKPTRVHRMKRNIELTVDKGVTSIVSTKAEVQSPVVCLKESVIVIPNVFLGVQTKTNIVLINQEYLPTLYDMRQAQGGHAEDCEIQVQERRGVIGAKEELTISLDFVAFREGEFSDVMVPVYIDGMDKPLAFSLNCDVKPLSVECTTSEDAQDWSSDQTLEFGNEVNLGSVPHRFLRIVNKTAIVAPFTVNVEHLYAKPPTPPGGEKSRKPFMVRTSYLTDPFSKIPGKAEAAFSTAMLILGHGAAFYASPSNGMLQAFSTQVVDISAYSDMWGRYNDKVIITVGTLEPMIIPISMTVVGSPLKFQITSASEEKNAVLRFGTHVSGVAPTLRGVRINNTSPHDIRLDWRVFNVDKDDKKIVDLNVYFGRTFPIRTTNGAEVVPRYIDPSLEKSVPSSYIPTSPDSSLVPSRKVTTSQESCISVKAEGKIINTFLRPHLGEETRRMYNIVPNQLVIPGRGHGQVTVMFTPLPPSEVPTDMECHGFAIGYMSVDGKACGEDSRIYRPEAFEATTVRLDMTSHLKPALLTVETTDDEGMVYQCAMSDLLTDAEQLPESVRIATAMLSNNTATPMVFRLQVKNPFSLVDYSGEFHTLHPHHNIMVKVAFHTTLELLDLLNVPEADEEVTASGRKLRIKDDLTIEFNNGSLQTIPLLATLTIPDIQLSKDDLDFGTCLVGQERIMEFSITNRTSAHSMWTAVKESMSETCISDTFQVLPSSGLLDAHITHVSDSEMLLKVSFIAKHEESYEGIFLFNGDLGEMTKRLHVRGQGSYDGRHEAVLNV